MKKLDNNDIVIGYIKSGEWVEYVLDTSEVNGMWESFNIEFNYGRGTEGSSKVVIYSNNKEIGSVDLASTGDWENHTSFTDDRVDVPIESDCTTLKFEFIEGGIDFDYFIILETTDDTIVDECGGIIAKIESVSSRISIVLKCK